MYLLDTNIVSELRKAGDGKSNPNVVAWLSSVDAAQFYLSAITVMEIELGILLIGRRDSTQAKKLRSWMDTHIRREFADRILPVDFAVAQCCAGLHVPNPRPWRDAFIGATAIVHGMTVVTRDTVDFEPTGVPLINPWNA